MLKFVLGGSGSGKTTLLYQRVKARAEAGQRSILLVPEQFTSSTEGRIYRELGDSLSGLVESFSFTSLAEKILSTEGERAAKSRKLATTVKLWSGLPVRMWDERQTTCAAADLLDESGTYGSKRKEILDSVSATVILDDYLAWRKDHPGEI